MLAGSWAQGWRHKSIAQFLCSPLGNYRTQLCIGSDGQMWPMLLNGSTGKKDGIAAPANGLLYLNPGHFLNQDFIQHLAATSL
jgi:hypothetical protein